VSVRLYHTIDTVVRSTGTLSVRLYINNLVIPTAGGSVFVYTIAVFNTTLWTGHVLRGAGQAMMAMAMMAMVLSVLSVL
jgi:hypothetical protein